MRQRVRMLLAAHDQVEIAGEAADGIEALENIRKLKPAVVFLDVQMPRLDGFGMLAHLPPGQRPIIVFITAYDEYAIRAFDVGAADYLLKPIQPERFATALARALERLKSKQSERAALTEVLRGARAQGHVLDRLVVERRGRMEIVPIERVRWLESVGNYVRVHTDHGEVHVIRTTLRALTDQLDEQRFLRIHRATIVQVARIVAVSPRGHGDATVTLDDGTQLLASRTRAAALRAVLAKRA